MLLWNGEETGFIQSAKQTLFNYTVKHLLKANNVQDAIDELSENLSENDKQFIFGYRDGKYGYYDGTRGADTFHPFNDISNLNVLMYTHENIYVHERAMMISNGSFTGAYAGGKIENDYVSFTSSSTTSTYSQLTVKKPCYMYGLYSDQQKIRQKITENTVLKGSLTTSFALVFE